MLVTPEAAPQALGSPEMAPTLGTLSPGRDDFFSSHFPFEKVHPPQSLERVLQLLLQSSAVLWYRDIKNWKFSKTYKKCPYFAFVTVSVSPL